MRLLCCTALFAALVTPCAMVAQEQQGQFGANALAETATPIRPGVPDKSPFWNAYAHQYIYAPAYQFVDVEGAVKYHFKVTSEAGGPVLEFDAEHPWAPLSPVWTKVPVGVYNVRVDALDGAGKSLAAYQLVGQYRAAWFNGPYNKPVMPYADSARAALQQILAKDYVQYWFDHKAPDPGYNYYRYPAKIWGALVVGAVTQARLQAGTPEAAKMTELARIVADALLAETFKPGTALEYIPATYHVKNYEKDFAGTEFNTDGDLTISAIDGGVAFLEIYDLTHDAKYLQEAERIARTLVKQQLPNGTWYTFVYPETGKPVYPNYAIPTSILNYFDRLMSQYHVEGLTDARNRAFKWLMDNPVKTFDWQAQFEDVAARPPYANQSREQACDLAIYLLRHRKDDASYLPLAEELMRYAEDQFVIWEKPAPRRQIASNREERQPGAQGANWITPSAQEQYTFWMPVGRTAAVMMETWRVAYEATGNPVYLAKAKSLANTFTVVQQVHNGIYPTFFTRFQMNFWLNSVVYPARFMMILDDSLKAKKN